MANCKCKHYCRSALHAALRHARKSGLHYDDDECNPSARELTDDDADKIHQLMEIEQMTREEIAVTVERLKEYNDWRRGDDTPQPHPEEIGVAIDSAIDIIESIYHAMDHENAD